MSLLGLFETGKSAIFASQTALNVVSNNIANANTPGYSRQEVILEVATPTNMYGDFLGRGVGNVEIRRHYDSFLHLQLVGQGHSLGRSFALDRGMSQVEQIFNEAEELGLMNPLEEYFNGWQNVATNPENANYRTVLLANADALVTAAKQMERDLKNTITYINDEIEGSINRINTITSNIAKLNKSISELESGLDDERASFFRDERDRYLNELGEMMDFNWFEDSNGAVTVLSEGTPLVEDSNYVQLTTSVNTFGNTDIYLGGKQVNANFESGQIGGYLDVRDDIENEPLHDLRKLIASITKETNSLHRAGYDLDGNNGNNFFDSLSIATHDNSAGSNVTSASITSPSALTLDEYDINFTTASAYEVRNHETGALVTSGTYSSGSPITFDGISVTITGTAAANDSFFVSPLTEAISKFNVSITDTNNIAAATSSGNLPGDNTNALSIAQLPQTAMSDLNRATYETYYEGMVSNVGVASKAAADSLEYDDNLYNELEVKRESVSGVNMDEEAANLIKYQRMFEAGARVLQVTDELLQTVLNI